MAHFHRAEIARMAGWRDRIDRTTNWAITVAAAMLSVSLSTPTAHHGVPLFAIPLIMLLHEGHLALAVIFSGHFTPMPQSTRASKIT
jgi:uncharacterized membrane protein